jgi:hypothetical protein
MRSECEQIERANVLHLRVDQVHGTNSHSHLLQLVGNIAHDGDVGVSVQEAVVEGL